MALDLRQNFFSAQYLENKMTYFQQILYYIDIDKFWLGVVTCHFSYICTRVMAPDLRQNFISAQYLLEQIDRISPNFIYAFTLTRSSMGLIHIIFFTFVPELWPLIYAKISFWLNILRIK